MDDLISREALIEEYEASKQRLGHISIVRMIERAPAVDPVQHGRWLDGRCTACGWEEPDECSYGGYENEPWKETPYCPNCGAKMDGGESHEP